MTKKRIVLLLVVLGILAGIGGGVWWYVRRSTGWRLLSRAQVAIQAGNYDEAIELAARYKQRNPDKWQGYYWEALAHSRSGQYEAARELLETVRDRVDAGRMTADMVDVRMLLADTYAHPARSKLTGSGDQLSPADLRAVIDGLTRANEHLERVQAEDRPRQLDVKQAMGRNLLEIGGALAALDTPEARTEAEHKLRRATEMLLEVVEADPSREDAAKQLVDLCLRRDDRQTLERGRTALVGAESLPPVAIARLVTAQLSWAEQTDAGLDAELRGEARRLLDDVISQHPDAAAPQVARARLAVVEGDLQLAERLCREVISDDPRHKEARLVLSGVMRRQGRQKEAELELATLTTDFRQWPPARFAYAQVLLDSGKKAHAMQMLTQLIDMAPQHAGALRLRAEVLREEGSDELAFAAAKEFYDAYPEDKAALRLLVDTADRTDQPSVALDALDAAQTAFEDDPQKLLFVAQGYQQLGRGEKARAVWRKLAGREAKETVALRAKVRALTLLGRSADAERLLTQRYEQAPSPEIAYALGRLYLDTGRPYQAVDMLRTAVRGDATVSEWKLALADALFASGELEECEDVLARVTEATAHAEYLKFRIRLARGESPSWEETVDLRTGADSVRQIAAAYLASGQAEQCVEACRRQLDKDPDQADLRWLMGRALLKLDRRSDAVEQWKRALQLDPGRLSLYRDLALVLAVGGKDVDEIASEIAGVTNARRDMTNLACGYVLEQRGDFAAAAELYAELADQSGGDIAARARLAQAAALARGGHVDKGLAELTRLAERDRWSWQAKRLKAKLLVADGRRKPAEEILAGLCRRAREGKNARWLQQIAADCAAAGAHEQALDALGALEKLRPDDPVVRVRQGEVLQRMGRPEEAAQAYEAAVALRPRDTRPYVLLARIRDEQLDLPGALAVLDRLKDMGQTERFVRLFERGQLFARWGLYARAAEAFEELTEEGAVSGSQLRYRLARALAGFGGEHRQRAMRLLRDIPSYAPQYAEAQRVLASMAPAVEDKLSILRKLDAVRPGRLDVLVDRMRLLLNAGRPEDAADAFDAFREAHADDGGVPPVVSLLGVRAMLQADRLAQAADLAERLRSATGRREWRLMTALLHLASDARKAMDVLPDPSAAGLYESFLGVCAAQKLGADTAPWLRRIETLDAQGRGATPERAVPLQHRVLAVLGHGDDAAAQRLLQEASSSGTRLFVESVAGRESHRPNAAEAATLLEAMVANDLGLTAWASRRAMDVLRARPDCLWAAALAVRTRGGGPSPAEVLEVLGPTDSLLGQALQAAAHLDAGEYRKAAELFRKASAVVEGDPALMFRCGSALEQAGMLKEARACYRRLWEATQSPLAANNAAYVTVRLSGRDPAALAEAQQLVEQAVAASDTPAFRDTLGWVLLLRGKTEPALEALRSAVRDLPASPEVHYHLGKAERAAGSKQLAEWHFTAAVRLTQRREEAGTATHAQKEAAAEARKELDSMRGAA